MISRKILKFFFETISKTLAILDFALKALSRRFFIDKTDLLIWCKNLHRFWIFVKNSVLRTQFSNQHLKNYFQFGPWFEQSRNRPSLHLQRSKPPEKGTKIQKAPYHHCIFFTTSNFTGKSSAKWLVKTRWRLRIQSFKEKGFKFRQDNSSGEKSSDFKAS